jgi:hypothetical protein
MMGGACRTYGREKAFVGRPQGTRMGPFGRPRNICKDIKMDVTDKGLTRSVFIHLVEDMI